MRNEIISHLNVEVVDITRTINIMHTQIFSHLNVEVVDITLTCKMWGKVYKLISFDEKYGVLYSCLKSLIGLDITVDIDLFVLWTLVMMLCRPVKFCNPCVNHQTACVFYEIIYYSTCWFKCF